MHQEKIKLIEAYNSFVKQGDVLRAQSMIEQAQQSLPEDPDIMFLYARTKFDKQEFSLAAKTAKSLLQKFPGVADVQNLYIESLIADRRYQAAIKESGRLAKRTPSIDLDLAVARAYALWDKTPLALRTLNAVIAAQPQTDAAHAMRGVLLNKQDRKADAIAAIQTALTIAPENVQYLFDLASIHLSLKDNGSAEALLEKAVALQPDHYRALATLGEINFKQSRLDKAVDYFERALNLHQAEVLVWSMYLNARATTGNAAEVAELAEKLVQKFPGSMTLMSDLAFVQCRAGNTDRVLQLSRQLREDPASLVTAIAFEAAALNKAGANDQAARILALDSLVTTRIVDPPEEWPSTTDFNAALTEEILNHPDLGRHETNRSLVREDCTFELFDNTLSGAIAGLRDIIDNEVAVYLERFDNADAGMAAYRAARPRNYKLECWANVMRRGGNHNAHFHPRAWLSGVYYPCLPERMNGGAENDNAGALEVGCSYAELLPARDEPSRFIKPVEGSIIMFPSYVGHRTVPVETDGKPRISMAFNVVAAD